MRAPTPIPVAAWLARLAWLGAWCFVWPLCAAGCASVRDDWHLAPLASHISRAGSGRETELAAGAVRVRTSDRGGNIESWALRPFLRQERQTSGDFKTRFLAPLGSYDWIRAEETFQILPLVRYHSKPQSGGGREHDFLMLPGILWRLDDTDRVVRAVFPIGGVIERFLTFERIEFVLFPLYARTKRNGRQTYHVLFPVVSWSSKPGEPASWRLWPLFGVSRTQVSDRRFWLWPLLHRERDHLDQTASEQGRRWMVFPLLGHSQRKTFDAWTLLWPIFGWARDSSTGFWSWDGPWPLVRLQRPGTSGSAVRTRAWPLYSHFQGDGLTSDWYLWPLINQRHEESAANQRDALYVLPFWQRWRKVDRQGRELERWRKLWPLYQEHSSTTEGSRVALVALNPLWHTPLIDDLYAWMYELFVDERFGEIVHQRSLAGLYKRERDEIEDRAYLGPLWARRTIAPAPGGARPVRETSLFLGLLRWRRDERGLSLLRPAFPGPGFPPRRQAQVP